MMMDKVRQRLFGNMVRRCIDDKPPLTPVELKQLEPFWNRYLNEIK